MLTKVAKIIRIISIPPILVGILLLSLYFTQSRIFSNISELLLSFLFLMVIPFFAYPISYLSPSIKVKGRDGQRKLAFIGSLMGYFGALIYGMITSVSEGLLFIYLTYLFSVILLTIFNKIIRVRASGHACSITGPLILMIYFIGWKCLIPCVLFFNLIIWASLYIKRHTPKELFFGALCASLAFLVNWAIYLF